MNQELISLINKLYGIGSVREIEPVNRGYLSTNFILKTAQQKYFLKQYRLKEKSKVIQVHQAKFLFARHDIPIILPLKNKLSNYFFSFNNHYYSLFPFIEGEIIERENLTKGNLQSLARMLARIHWVSKKEECTIDDQARGYNKDNFLLRAQEICNLINQKNITDNFDKRALEILALKIYIVQNNTIVYEDSGLKNDHLIHGDYHEQNLFFNSQGEVSWVFDLEKATMSPRVLEVIRALDFICFNGDFEECNFIKSAWFLREYQARYPLEPEELERGITIFYLKRAHSLWIESEHYLYNNKRVDLFLEYELKMLKYFSKQKKYFIEQLVY